MCDEDDSNYAIVGWIVLAFFILICASILYVMVGMDKEPVKPVPQPRQTVRVQTWQGPDNQMTIEGNTIYLTPEITPEGWWEKRPGGQWEHHGPGTPGPTPKG